MVQERVRQDRVVDITAFDMGASTSKVKQFAPILDLVIEDVLASTCAEVQDSVGGTQDRIDVGIQGDARVGVAETAYVALGEESLSQRQTVNELGDRNRMFLPYR